MPISQPNRKLLLMGVQYKMKENGTGFDAYGAIQAMCDVWDQYLEVGGWPALKVYVDSQELNSLKKVESQEAGRLQSIRDRITELEGN